MQLLKQKLYIFATQCHGPYQRFTPSSCKDIRIRKFEFVEKTQFLWQSVRNVFKIVQPNFDPERNYVHCTNREPKTNVVKTIVLSGSFFHFFQEQKSCKID